MDTKFEKLSENEKKKLTKYTLTSDGLNQVGEVYLKKEEPNSLFIMWLEIYPEYRRQGFGRTIMNHVIRVAKEIGGYDRISLLVDYKNESAQALYKSVGFAFTGEVKHYDFPDGRSTYSYEMEFKLR